MCIQLIFDFTLTMDILAGHTEQGLASRIQKVEDALSNSLDPIDWSFQQPLVAASRARAYQRVSVVMGPLVQLKRLHLRASTAHASLPRPINVLPVVAPQQVSSLFLFFAMRVRGFVCTFSWKLRYFRVYFSSSIPV